MRKHVVVCLLLCAVMCCFFAITGMAATVASGTCGEKLTWALDDSGKLTIEGTGAMTDWADATNVPWYEKRSSITSVKIGDSVTGIGDAAFYYCKSLSSIEIPDSVNTIGDAAFCYCKSLTSVTIGDSVNTIGEDAFNYCGSLTNIEIPASVTSIGTFAFVGCESLTSIMVTEDNTAYTSLDGVLYNKEQTELLCCPMGKTGNFVIPVGITSIGNSAFGGCVSLTSIVIPIGVISIGNSAFGNCESLTSINIPDSVTSIGMLTFGGCYKLTSVKIPDGVTSIEDGMFCFCGSLANIEIPDSVTSIGSDAFYACGNLRDIYYVGSEESWRKLSDENNLGIDEEKVTIHFMSQTHVTDTHITNTPISVMLNGQKLSFDVEPQIINGRTMVPMRAIFEALGAMISWNSDLQLITAEKNGSIVRLTIGDFNMDVDGSVKTLDVAPCIINNRTLVPVRAISEAFQLKVDWAADTRTVTITK